MKTWSNVAARMVQGLGVRQGELIEVQDDSGRPEVLKEVLFAIEQVGATPLPRIAFPDHLARIIAEAPLEYINNWDQHRGEWLAKVDRKIIMGSVHPDLSAVPPGRIRAWQRAIERLTQIETKRNVPILVAGIPSRARAEQSGLSFDALEELLLPALCATVAELQTEIEKVLTRVQGCQEIVIRTGKSEELRLATAGRRWLSDDAYIDDRDRECGAIISNLPGGSVYTSVVESETEGTLWLPKAGPARNVTLRFNEGRVNVDAVSGADALTAMFDQHTGEPRRISHVGVGLNPYLHYSIDWTLIDEHVHGHLFIAFGENRYMGGENKSSLNVDYSVPAATLLADGQLILKGSELVSPL